MKCTTMMTASMLAAAVACQAAAPQSNATKRARTARTAPDAAALVKRIPQTFSEFAYTADVVYKTVDGRALQLDLLTPKGLTNEAAPLLVYIHGGGWGGGDRYRMLRADIAGVIKRCGAAGIISATIEYRLTGEKSSAFDAASDCKDALRFLVKNAKKYRIDPARIGTIGGSAGGHLSLVTALGDPKDFPGDPALAGFDPPSIRCEVAHYPATDFTDIKLAERFLGARAAIMFGGPPEQKADVIRLLSPVCLIRKDSPPVYCFHGDMDTTLSVENSRRLYAKGKAVGADIRYTEVKNGTHGFGAACTPSIDEIVDLASRFVIEHLK